MALIRQRVCAGWLEHLLVAHTTLLEISCRGLNGKHTKQQIENIKSTALERTAA